MDCVHRLDTFIGNAGSDAPYDPLVLSYMVHYQFEAIHPFRDGNGRVGRLLLALTTYAWQPLYLPWLYMSAYFERFKDEYVDNMFRVSTHGDWERWIEFCLRGTIAQCKDAIKRCEGLFALRGQMHQRLDGYARMAAIVDNLFINPVFTAPKVAEWGKTSMPTARRDIELLEETGFVKYLNGERPKKYYVPGIFVVAYNEGNQDDEASDVAEVDGQSDGQS
jgi:Fic family protein